MEKKAESALRTISSSLYRQQVSVLANKLRTESNYIINTSSLSQTGK